MLRRSLLGAAAGSAVVPAPALAAALLADGPRRPLHLLSTYVAGTADCGAAAVVEQLRPGYPVSLRRAADNSFDPRTIEVWDGQVLLGHLPGVDCRILAPMMDAGARLRAKVRSVRPHPEKPGIALDLSLAPARGAA